MLKGIVGSSVHLIPKKDIPHSRGQSAFLPNRQILDGAVVINELIDYAKRRKKNCLMCKIDFEKAYVSVNWSLLDYMLQRLGFCDQWRSWVKACICSGSASVLVNGSPTKEFILQRRLKQGDPLVPFLFLVVAEGLSGLVTKAEEQGCLKALRLKKGKL